MIKYNFYVILVFILFVSCMDRRDTMDKFGEYSLRLLNSESDAREIYIMPKDSIRTKNNTLLNWMNSLNDKAKFSNYIESQSKEISAWREKSLSLNIKQNTVKYLRTEIETDKNLDSKQTNLRVFFLIGNKEHFFNLIDVDSLDKKWVTYRISKPTNQEEVEIFKRQMREKSAKEPYIPWGLNFTFGNWKYKYADTKTFSIFFVTLKNSTLNDFKRIKFRIVIYQTTNSGKIEVFSKVVEKTETIYPGDILRIEILELRDFYLGVNIAEKNTFEWTGEILDAKPKPGFEDLAF